MYIHPKLETYKTKYPHKFVLPGKAFRAIRRGGRIFIGTGCGEPQYLVSALGNYAAHFPKNVIDTELFQVWSLGVAPYAEARYQSNFRHNSFFIGDAVRSAVNEGLADYTPIFLSEVPRQFEQGQVPIDVALIQTSLPDARGYVSLGVSVDIVKAAVQCAKLVIAQVNAHMPRVLGDGFIHLDQIDYIVSHDEPVLEYAAPPDSDAVGPIGKYVASLIQDGDTLQVGYGSTPNAVLTHLRDKRDLGIHTELLSDGLIELIKVGAVNNRRKSLNKGRTVATFCMGSQTTYGFIDDNPMIEFRTIDYTNNPLVVARQERMTAINTCMEIDLTGQANAESIGNLFYSGIGGQADFMRGAVLAPRAKRFWLSRPPPKTARFRALCPRFAPAPESRSIVVMFIMSSPSMALLICTGAVSEKGRWP